MPVSVSEIKIDPFDGFEIIVRQGASQSLYDCLVLQGISHSHSREYGVEGCSVDRTVTTTMKHTVKRIKSRQKKRKK